MSRPEHLNCVNAAEGIRRINMEQEIYDKDPEKYEREGKERQEENERQAMFEQEEQARAEAQWQEEQARQQEYEQEQQGY